MASRPLSPGALNRALLSRQLLLDRSGLPAARALERIGGLQTQYAPSGYIGLYSRLRDFRRVSLTRALEQRRVVQATMMRATIHMTSPADYGLFTAGVRRHRRQWWERVSGSGAGAADLAAGVEWVLTQLREGPRRQRDLAKGLADAGFPRLALQAAHVYLDIVRVPPSGTWERRRADLFGLAEAEVGALPTDEDTGVNHLLQRYLQAFGPAPLRSAATWAGVPLPAIQEAAQRLRLRRFGDNDGGELIDVPRAALPGAGVPAPVRFLPTWDAILLVHARHAAILPERFRPHIFNTKMPQSIPTFLVDGAVAGTWREVGGRVEVQYLEPIPARFRRLVDDEAAQLQGWLTSTD